MIRVGSIVLRVDDLQRQTEFWEAALDYVRREGDSDDFVRGMHTIGAPLRYVPEDKVVVLGLVTTKTPRRESVDELARRIEEASRFVPLERLALSPQCGFATSIVGNAISPEDQWAKLRTIADTARLVWG